MITSLDGTWCTEQVTVEVLTKYRRVIGGQGSVYLVTLVVSGLVHK